MSGEEPMAVKSNSTGSIIWENLLFSWLLRRTMREAHRRAKRELRRWQNTTNSLLTDLVPSY